MPRGDRNAAAMPSSFSGGDSSAEAAPQPAQQPAAATQHESTTMPVHQPTGATRTHHSAVQRYPSDDAKFTHLHQVPSLRIRVRFLPSDAARAQRWLAEMPASELAP
eukprot:8200887-Pyramimonas_sp.AAC.1